MDRLVSWSLTSLFSDLHARHVLLTLIPVSLTLSILPKQSALSQMSSHCVKQTELVRVTQRNGYIRDDKWIGEK